MKIRLKTTLLHILWFFSFRGVIVAAFLLFFLPIYSLSLLIFLIPPPTSKVAHSWLRLLASLITPKNVSRKGHSRTWSQTPLKILIKEEHQFIKWKILWSVHCSKQLLFCILLRALGPSGTDRFASVYISLSWSNKQLFYPPVERQGCSQLSNSNNPLQTESLASSKKACQTPLLWGIMATKNQQRK